ncbi:MAG: antitoxin Xre/MbcA/ParS toxin-binding domain-containing protein [Myxococcaceae bacterium]|nr:antitoxin Xre/MbcA/ParS toxin-binding domain-containing protein [Myxococcaceae bacterium]
MRPCLQAPPPAAELPAPWDGGCPVELCLDTAGTHQVLDHLGALERYARDAWLLCGVRDGGAPSR